MPDDDPTYDVDMLETEVEMAYDAFVQEGGLDQTFVLSEDIERQRCLDQLELPCQKHGIRRKFCVICHGERD